MLIIEVIGLVQSSEYKSRLDDSKRTAKLSVGARERVREAGRVVAQYKWVSDSGGLTIHSRSLPLPPPVRR